MSVQISYKKQFTIALLLAIVLLASLEGISRTYEFISPRCSFIDSPVDAFENVDFFLLRMMCNDTSLVAHIKSDILLIAPDQHFGTININSHGFRGPEFSQDKPFDTYRIFVVGGSTTYGVGSTSDQTTIPGYLQQKYSEINLPINVEVINAGIGGAESTRETYMIKNILLDFDPDLFIIYDGWNDAQTNPYELNIAPKNDNDSDENIFKFANFPYYRTPFVIHQILFLHNIEANEKFLDNSLVPQRISNWKNNWIESCTQTQQHEIKTILTVQPLIGSGKKILTEDESKWDGTNNVELKSLEGFASSLSELDSFCYDTADLRSSFDNFTEPIFFDIGHTNDFGNNIIAEKLFELSYPIVLEDINR